VGAKFEWSLRSGFHVGVEPSILVAGAEAYRFVQLGVPVIGGYRRRVERNLVVTVAVGVSPLVLARAYRVEPEEDHGDDWSEHEGIRGWDVALVAVLGIDLPTRTSVRYSLELRATRGLVTLDTGAFPLNIYNQEVGLWFGWRR
ncbi:MAG TPA: hypothetical protein VK427_26535, partial [Kofleriaceae bacterium]|nr:hypothetical protein [Kofleriaceae bacterium]